MFKIIYFREIYLSISNFPLLFSHFCPSRYTKIISKYLFMITALKARPGMFSYKWWTSSRCSSRDETWRSWRYECSCWLKNLMQGNSSDRVLDSEEKLEDVILDRAKAEFLYESAGTFAFMNQDTYETVEALTMISEMQNGISKKVLL